MHFYPRPPRGGRPRWAGKPQKPMLFLSTPSARRATRSGEVCAVVGDDFYPRPPRGGRRSCGKGWSTFGQFLSTPSARRATQGWHHDHHGQQISIHALREEGDQAGAFTAVSVRDFYPRPPRGGRLMPLALVALASLFLSTPSARRATNETVVGDDRIVFLSTPSARRATSLSVNTSVSFLFLSTPSARRATLGCRPRCRFSKISIHALREEGDVRRGPLWRGLSDFYPRPPRGGRPSTDFRWRKCSYFYPRPPRGGRLRCAEFHGQNVQFLSTPSARRATYPTAGRCNQMRHFYPRPPRGGRPA